MIEIILIIALISVFLIDYVVRKKRKASTKEIEKFNNKRFKIEDLKPVIFSSFFLFIITIILNQILFNGFFFNSNISKSDFLNYKMYHSDEISHIAKIIDSISQDLKTDIYTLNDNRELVTGIIYNDKRVQGVVINGLKNGEFIYKTNENYKQVLYSGEYSMGKRIGLHKGWYVDSLENKKLKVDAYFLGNGSLESVSIWTPNSKKIFEFLARYQEYEFDGYDLTMWGNNNNDDPYFVINCNSNYENDEKYYDISYRQYDFKGKGVFFQNNYFQYEELNSNNFFGFLLDYRMSETKINFSGGLLNKYFYERNFKTSEINDFGSWDNNKVFQSEEKLWRDKNREKLKEEIHFNIDPPNTFWVKSYNLRDEIYQHFIIDDLNSFKEKSQFYKYPTWQLKNDKSLVKYIIKNGKKQL